ncbi:MAG: hypothetical protein UU22_C0050G0009 [Parcubacteria group bacterium GW2011_GWA2_40_8]|nr:MAG: hypothetical protein UU22_C0050G0009 [Parcubacteria group bacterium GW2011_GWA2_40_8]
MKIAIIFANILVNRSTLAEKVFRILATNPSFLITLITSLPSNEVLSNNLPVMVKATSSPAGTPTSSWVLNFRIISFFPLFIIALLALAPAKIMEFVSISSMARLRILIYLKSLKCGECKFHRGLLCSPPIWMM